jgi:hypothetical protein
MKLTREAIYHAYHEGLKALMQLLKGQLGDSALAVQFTPFQQQELIKVSTQNRNVTFCAK